MTEQKRRPTEYRLRIDAYSPDTMPMARLAEYMSELATLLGEQTAVHFQRLERGSTVLVSKIETEAVPKVRERVNAMRRQRGPVPDDALRAYRKMNNLLREDNGVASLKERGNRAVVISFPGREDAQERYPLTREYGSIEGTVVSVAGKDHTVHVRLLVESGTTLSGIYTTNRQIGKALAHLFDEPVRLEGMGSWKREDSGTWKLEAFKIESFEELTSATLSHAITELRELSLKFDDGAFEELDILRHGAPKANGGH